MKSILQYLQKFWKTDFDPLIYALTILGLGIAIYFNYLYDFEDSIVDSYRKQPISLLYYFLYYGAAYYYVIALYLIFKRDIPGLKSRQFVIKSLFVLALIAFKVFFYFDETWTDAGMALHERYAYIKTSKAIASVSIYTIGLIVFYYFFEKDKSNWYGLTTKGFNWRPYAIMLLIMVPLIAMAATQPDFLKAYPRFKTHYFETGYWFYFSIYEPFYLLGFVMVEWLFRGFLVVGMVHLLGHRAILPAAAFYCVFHFGKPLGECISSFFGGYILGVFAYYSRSIWGGIIVHMGIALLMDLAAIFVKFAL